MGKQRAVHFDDHAMVIDDVPVSLDIDEQDHNGDPVLDSSATDAVSAFLAFEPSKGQILILWSPTSACSIHRAAG